MEIIGALEKYILAVISIVCCLLGFWMGRRTQGPIPGQPAKVRDLLRRAKREAMPEPESDLLNQAMGTPDDDYRD